VASPLDAPWYAPYAPWLARIAEPALAGRWAVCLAELNRLALAQGLVNARGLPLRFVERLPDDGLAYEARIDATGLVHTRADDGAWHDLFNAVVWLAFPRTKARLNALQAAAIARDGVGARRGALRDAATLFDENAALVVLREPGLRAVWRVHDWPTVFGLGGARPAWSVPPLIFGHALLDKLRAPYKAACAHAWLLDPAAVVAGGSTGAERPVIDAAVAAGLDQGLAREAFLPLPVLGVPGWWPASADPVFYDDPAVFRPSPRRRVRSGSMGPAPGRRASDGPASGRPASDGDPER